MVFMGVALALALQISPQIPETVSPPSPSEGADLVEACKRSLSSAKQGSVVFASTFRQDRITPEDCLRVAESVADDRAAHQLREFLRSVKAPADLQPKMDNATMQHLLWTEDGSYYLHKYTGSGLPTESRGCSDWTYYANGKRVLEVTAVVGEVGRAIVSTQPANAAAQLWMKGLAAEHAAWITFLSRHGKPIGGLWVWAREDASAPRLHGLRLPIWEALVRRATLAVTKDERAGAITCTVSLLDGAGRELVQRYAIVTGRDLVRVGARTFLPTTTLTFSHHEATSVGPVTTCHAPIDAVMAARVPYVIDETNASARLYIDDGLPDDIVNRSHEMMRAVASLRSQEAVLFKEGEAESGKTTRGMAMLELFPRHIRIGRPTEDVAVQAWLVNASAESIEVLDAGASCGCIQVSCPKGPLRPWQTFPVWIKVRHKDIDPSRGGERVTFVCDGPLGRGIFVTSIEVDK